MTLLATWKPTGAAFETYPPVVASNLQEDTIVIQSDDSTMSPTTPPTGGVQTTITIKADAACYVRSAAGGNSYILAANWPETIRFPSGTRLPTTLFVQGVAGTANISARKA